MTTVALVILAAIAIALCFGDRRQSALLAVVCSVWFASDLLDPAHFGGYWWALLCFIEVGVIAAALAISARATDTIVALSVLLVMCHLAAESLLAPMNSGDPYAAAVFVLECSELIAFSITSRRFVSCVAWVLTKYRQGRPPCNLKTSQSGS